jgi:Limiting CO2-inducible proteins B/C beta carbonyic anhydrases
MSLCADDYRFGAMAAHIPDDGFCLMIYGPHVGVAKDGAVGKVERRGIELVDTCCGSAVAASNYLKGITEGGAKITTKIQTFSDFQQVRCCCCCCLAAGTTR